MTQDRKAIGPIEDGITAGGLGALVIWLVGLAGIELPPEAAAGAVGLIAAGANFLRTLLGRGA